MTIAGSITSSSSGCSITGSGLSSSTAKATSTGKKEEMKSKQNQNQNQKIIEHSNIKISTTRQAMKTYWEYHRDQSPIHTNETMMLDSNADILHEKEKHEIFSCLPLSNNTKVLELASGIGRYTGSIAEKVEHVTSVEFIHEFYEGNKKNNQHHNNIEFVCEDVMNLSKNTLPYTSYDLVFSNWLLMYLNDHEIQIFLENVSQFLVPGGYFFFRESCWQPSGDQKHSSDNPTYYRHPSYYINLFNYTKQYDLVSSSNITVYRQVKKNPGQIWFLFQKKITIPKEIQNKNEELTFQQFLDVQQYSKSSIHRYELIFGPGYVSTGGQLTTTEFVQMLDLQPKQYVLDVGCGIGGGDVYMAKNFNVGILGIDLSSNMIYEAIERSIYQEEPHQVSGQIQYMINDITTKEFDENTFDVIYSRDTILHIKDKEDLFSKFYKWLKPNGKLLISDYCCCENLDKTSEEFQSYVKSRGYTLLSVENYGQVLQQVGFYQVQALDRTKQFLDILNMEVKKTKQDKTEYIKNTSQKDYDDIINGWEAKIQRCTDGEQRWGLFYAEKLGNA